MGNKDIKLKGSILMGKQPATGTKKTKAAMAKAAQSRKGAKKKWTKGKVKDKVNHAVFIEAASENGYELGIHKVGRLVSVSTFVDKFKVNGSVARAMMKKMCEKGVLKQIVKHTSQLVYTQAHEPKKQEVKEEKKTGGGGKKKKPRTDFVIYIC